MHFIRLVLGRHRPRSFGISVRHDGVETVIVAVSAVVLAESPLTSWRTKEAEKRPSHWAEDMMLLVADAKLVLLMIVMLL